MEVPPGQVGRVRACPLVNAESDVYIEARVRYEENLEWRAWSFWHEVSSKKSACDGSQV